MSGHIRRDIERIEIMVVNQQMNKAVVEKFKDYCKLLGYPTNIVLETFMLQYADDRFSIPAEEIRKWEQEVHEIDVLGTTVSKDIYIKFRQACRDNGFYIKYVITAFMEKFSTRSLRMEYVDENNLGSAPKILSAEEYWNAESAKIQSHKNDKLRCPYCGRYVEGVSDNWVLIQPYGDGKNYLACKECGGHV